jgi:hypothetical protein
VGGDEFVVLANISDRHELAAQAHTLEDAISAEPVSVNAQTTHVAVTVRAAMLGSVSDFGLLFEH